MLHERFSFRREKDSMPLLKSLKGQSDLIEINLKRVMLEDSGMKLLCQGLPTSLRKLNLSCNNLTLSSVEELCEVVSKRNPGQKFEDLADINLSFNPIGDLSNKPIIAIMKELNMRTISLQSCFLGSDFIQTEKDRWLELLQGQNFLEEMQIGFNNLSFSDIDFLQKNTPSQCEIRN